MQAFLVGVTHTGFCVFVKLLVWEVEKAAFLSVPLECRVQQRCLVSDGHLFSELLVHGSLLAVKFYKDINRSPYKEKEVKL